MDNGTQYVKTSLNSCFVEVMGSSLHYLESGNGSTMLFLHGMPTSSYLWRHIIPELSQTCRCIAPDLVGMGLSDKPDIKYTVFEHIEHIEAFIEALELKDITLVLHGWGSVIGFEYARRHPENVVAVAFYESHLRPILEWDMLSLPVQQLAAMLQEPSTGRRAVVERNYMIEQLLPSGAVDPLSDEVMSEYAKPFSNEDSRKLLWQYLSELPIGSKKTLVVELIEGYSKWLQSTDIPKLLLYAVPGFITTMDTVVWARDHLSNLTLESLEDVMHFAQESSPNVFSNRLFKWYDHVNKGQL